MFIPDIVRVYRLSNTQFAKDLSGEGARLHGGRWNHIGTSCVYTSQSRSLAVLELSVNISVTTVLRYLSMVEIEIPDDMLALDVSSLPANWREAPAPASTKDYGTDLFKKNTGGIIKIPSAVIPEEYNYLINPHQVRAGYCTIMHLKDFVYDMRIKVFV